MKILRLKALNINSLKGETDIDFRALLKENALFAITGPTGSGKSTLLDIITCALYARTPRLRNANDLMSRHCGEAFCEVEFEIKGKAYRSSWSQRRARKAHDGKFQSAKMELSDVQTGKIIKSGTRDVIKYIEEISGLDFERFTQSMMLAQGSFDAFLKAKESERSTLLEKITGTKIYANISKKVHEQYSKQLKEMDIDKRLLENIEFLDQTTKKEKEHTLQLHKEEQVTLSQQLHEYTLQINWLEKLSTLKSNHLAYTTKHKEALEEQALKEKDFIRLDLATKALTLQPSYERKIYLNKQISTEILSLEELKKQSILFSKERETNRQQFTQLTKEVNEARSNFSQESVKIKKAREIAVQESEQKKVFTGLKALYQEKKARQELLHKRLNNAHLKVASLEKACQESQKTLKENKKDKALIERIALVDQEVQQYTACESKIKVLKQTQIEVEKRFLLHMGKEEPSLRLNKEQLYIDELKEHIATLRIKKEQELLIQKYEADREKLLKDEACFLCGSTEHPYKLNTYSVQVDETEKQIKKKILVLDTSESQYRALKQSHYEYTQTSIQTKKELHTVTTQMQTIEQKLLPLWKSYELTFTTENLSETYALLLEKKEQYVQELNRYDALEKSLAQLTLEHKEDEVESIELQKQIEEHTDSLAKSEILLKTLESKKANILDVLNIDNHEKDLILNLKNIESKEQSMEEAIHILTLNIKHTTEQENKLSLNLQMHHREHDVEALTFQKLLKENGFQNKDQFIDASLATKEREVLQVIYDEVHTQLIETSTLLENSQHELTEHTKNKVTSSSMEFLAKEQSLLKEHLDVLKNNIGRDEKELEIDRLNQTKHSKSIVELERKQTHFKVWAKLQELIGSADGTKFSKYAQGITLDHLIALANIHLENLSQRYVLIRSKEEKELLEIEIIDQFQGNVLRPVSTLSGGESFILSLALALGLSELASQKISIDSLFLDEGFGTLDEESLETALNALSLLQDKGKMIGVISHVEALKEYITLQITLSPKGDGTSKAHIIN